MANEVRANQVSDIEVPVIVSDVADTTSDISDEQLDLANIVQSAAKGLRMLVAKGPPHAHRRCRTRVASAFDRPDAPGASVV